MSHNLINFAIQVIFKCFQGLFARKVLQIYWKVSQKYNKKTSALQETIKLIKSNKQTTCKQLAQHPLQFLLPPSLRELWQSNISPLRKCNKLSGLNLCLVPQLPLTFLIPKNLTNYFRYEVAPPAPAPIMEPLPQERTMLKEQQRRARILEKEQRYESEKHYHKRK